LIIQQGWVDCINFLLDIRSTEQAVLATEEFAGILHRSEFKLLQAKLFNIPKSWREAYPESSFTVVYPDNY
jgi:hypothetical protein